MVARFCRNNFFDLLFITRYERTNSTRVHVGRIEGHFRTKNCLLRRKDAGCMVWRMYLHPNVEKLFKNHLYFTSRIEKNYV